MIIFNQQAPEKRRYMAQNLKSVECDPACGFMIRSHDETELMSMVKSHVRSAHQKNLSDQEVKDKMKAA